METKWPFLLRKLFSKEIMVKFLLCFVGYYITSLVTSHRLFVYVSKNASVQLFAYIIEVFYLNCVEIHCGQSWRVDLLHNNQLQRIWQATWSWETQGESDRVIFYKGNVGISDQMPSSHYLYRSLHGPNSCPRLSSVLFPPMIKVWISQQLGLRMHLTLLGPVLHDLKPMKEIPCCNRKHPLSAILFRFDP